MGFCFGGAQSWAQSANNPGLGGHVGFYGRPERVEDKVDRMSAPLLMLMGGADQASTPAGVASAGRARAGSRVRVELHVYEGAPHSFFDRSFAEHRDACADAWRRILTFVGHPAALTAAMSWGRLGRLPLRRNQRGEPRQVSEGT